MVQECNIVFLTENAKDMFLCGNNDAEFSEVPRESTTCTNWAEDKSYLEDLAAHLRDNLPLYINRDNSSKQVQSWVRRNDTRIN